MSLPDDPARFLRNPALRTSTGAVIRLPIAFDPIEVALPGNFREFAGGVVALYDPTSKTGLVYVPAPGRWTTMQPVDRAEFEAALAQGTDLEAALAPGSDAAQ